MPKPRPFTLERLGRLLKEELYTAASTFGARHRDSAWKEIANGANLSPSTVRSLATGVTSFPRFSTIEKLFSYFGMELIPIKKKVGNVTPLTKGVK